MNSKGTAGAQKTTNRAGVKTVEKTAEKNIAAHEKILMAQAGMTPALVQKALESLCREADEIASGKRKGAKMEDIFGKQ